jgi:RNA polymerase sigma-70 factor (ECF subfamily)
MLEPDDKELVRRCLKGDLKAFEPLLERYQKPVFNIALRILSDTGDAADVTQSTFLKAYENLSSYNERYKFFSWLYRIAVNTSLNLLEQKRRSDLLGDVDVVGTDSTEEQLHTAERVEKLEDAILNLSLDYRVVIVLRHFHDLSYEEIAVILDIPEKTVKSRLFTGRQLLKDMLMKAGLVE